MLIVYWSAQYISSGLMSVLLGFLPFFAGLFSWLLLRENILSPARGFALIMALSGLWLIHCDQLALSAQAVKGVLGMLVVAAIWGASSVWVKSLGVDIPPLRQSTGALGPWK
jgi:drug/metabolite transporter (DMT)-like permease